MRMKNWLGICLLTALLALPAFGQVGGGGGRGFGGPGGQQFDPAMIQQFIAQMQQRQLDNIKTQLGSSDDEFAALLPYVKKIMDLQTATQISRFSGMRIGGQSIGAMLSNTGGQPSDLQQATTALQAAIDDQTTTPQIFSIKLQALRDARAKTQADLTAAQNALRDLLTQRQEATLVLIGFIQ